MSPSVTIMIMPYITFRVIRQYRDGCRGQTALTVYDHIWFRCCAICSVRLSGWLIVLSVRFLKMTDSEVFKSRESLRSPFQSHRSYCDLRCNWFTLFRTAFALLLIRPFIIWLRYAFFIDANK